MKKIFNFKILFVISILLIVIGLSLKEERYISVEVKGSVLNKGVFKITDDITVEEVLKKAVLTSDADTSQINLSKKVYDEMVIIVPTKEEIKSLSVNKPYKIIENTCVCPKIINDSCITLDATSDEVIKPTKVSLNNASLEELMTLKGIGESKARAIIEYRKYNKFNQLEDIMNIKGIGKSIYEKIKDDISL